MNTRRSWADYFLDLAETVSTRATCPRKAVGCVLVKDRRIVATGYNGAPKGCNHCDEVGCQLVDMGGRESCVRSIHAEANAILQAGREAIGSTAYVTIPPCYECAKLIVQAGIVRVWWRGQYAGANRYGVDTAQFLEAAGVGARNWP